MMSKMFGLNALTTLIALMALALLAGPALAEETVAAVSTHTAEKVALGDAPAATAGATETGDPRPVVEEFHAGLIEIMKEAKTLGFQGRIDRLTPLMKRTFDLDFMASKTVGRHWRTLSDEDKQRWIATFTRLTVANYAGRFTGFTGEEFVTLGEEEAARNTRMVLTKITVPESDDVDLNYRLIEQDGNWRVIDVYLNGTVSELALRRSEYSSALKREGFEELVAAIETKIEDLKAKGRVEG